MFRRLDIVPYGRIQYVDVHEGPIARKLGVSIKLAHQLLTRMVQKGLLHVTVVHSRRWDYFLTPTGLAEKSRLTLEFLEFSMRFYREARRRSSALCRQVRHEGIRTVGFLGAGDLAEIAYLGVREWGLQLEDVYDDGERCLFMGVPVRPLQDLTTSHSAILVVCSYDTQSPMGTGYLPREVVPDCRMRWIFDASAMPANAEGACE